ncbi:MAG: helix-turn-helix transcriptional regulator [Desulfobacterales bacterium]
MAQEIHLRYLKENEAAELTGFAVQTLRNKRHIGEGPPYIKKGRAVRYPLQDLITWMESDRVEVER